MEKNLLAKSSIALMAVPLSAAMAFLAAPANAIPVDSAAAAGQGPASSPTAHATLAAPGRATAQAPPGNTTITFSEFPVGTPVSSQYKPRGIIFGGDSPFITTDASNPTSPVLSGTPLFTGAITGTFVRPNGTKRKVGHFSLDVGYIDNPGSVAVTAFNSSGATLTTISVNQTGIVPITVKAAGIASFSVAETSSETAGFAIDNVSFPTSLDLAALGDSYSSGEGNPPFIPGGGACDRSSEAWPVLLGKQDPAISPVADIACSGAESTALTGAFKGQPAQVTQLQNMKQEPDLVTLTMGGNDVGFASVLRDCYLHNCVKDHRLEHAQADINKESGTLVADYHAIKKAAPDATVVVVGYPRIFPPTEAAQTQCHAWLADNERAGLNHLTDSLDQVIASAAQKAGVKHVSNLTTLQGHELCTDHPWVYPIGLSGGDNRGHPTIPGQKAIESIVQKFVDSL